MTESVHQTLMNQAYDKWSGEWKGLPYSQFIERLSHVQRLAVLTGNLNYQVENGGWDQWFLNGYGDHAERLIGLLSKHTERPGVSEVISLIGKARTANNYLGEDARPDSLARFDNAYYDLQEVFLTSVEAILRDLSTENPR